jgi:hypothetical protein
MSCDSIVQVDTLKRRQHLRSARLGTRDCYFSISGRMSYKREHRRQYPIDAKRQSVKGSLHGRGVQKRYPGINLAKQVFAEKSKRSQTQDLLKMAQIAPNISAWLKCPNRLDLPGLDTPDAALVFAHRSKRSQAQDLARAARQKVPVEVWIGDPSRFDIKGVDTPSSKKPRRFKPVPKEDAKKIEAEKKQGRKLPTKGEILERAQAIHKEELVKQGLPAISAEEGELKESGTFEEARVDLMRGEQSKADAQIEGYIHDLNSELEPMGYRVVEID